MGTCYKTYLHYYENFDATKSYHFVVADASSNQSQNSVILSRMYDPPAYTRRSNDTYINQIRRLAPEISSRGETYVYSVQTDTTDVSQSNSPSAPPPSYDDVIKEPVQYMITDHNDDNCINSQNSCERNGYENSAFSSLSGD